MERRYPHLKLHNDPLSLVLCQIRFSRIRRMGDFVPAIQDELRRRGYPEDTSGVIRQLLVNAQGAHATESKRDEFRSKDGHWSISVDEGQLVLISTDYDRYKGFAEQLRLALEVVNMKAELELAQIHRIGLRYVDVIAPREGESHREYLQESLHGPKTAAIDAGSQIMSLESAGRTEIGTMIIRITQNNAGAVIPADLVLKPMAQKVRVELGKLITLLDTDHYVEGKWDFDIDAILGTVDALHVGVNNAWFNDLITEHAKKAWGAEHVED